MKDLLLQFARYNIWANDKVTATLLALDDHLRVADVRSSYPSLFKTVLHVASAEYIWLQRLQLLEHPVWLETGYADDFNALGKTWTGISSDIERFIAAQYDDKSFDHIMQYYDRKGHPWKNRVADVLLHVFNHSTYHRGQMITMLRQLDLATIPNTDFIQFIRK